LAKCGRGGGLPGLNLAPPRPGCSLRVLPNLPCQPSAISYQPSPGPRRLDDKHLDELARDIKANGLRLPIVTLDEKILDGRRRFMACRIAGIAPLF